MQTNARLHALGFVLLLLGLFSTRPSTRQGRLAQTTRSPDTLKLSGATIDSSSPRLPRALVGDIVIDGTHTIDGTTITAPLNTGIRRLFLGEEHDPVASAGPAETDTLLSILNPGLSAPEHINLLTNPTDAVAQTFSILLRGPFDLRQLVDPTLFMEVDPTTMGTVIVSYSLTARVHSRPYAGGVPKRVFRSGKGASAEHTVSLGTRPVDATYIKVGAASKLAEMHISDASGSFVEDIWTANQAQKLVQQYADWKNAVPVAAPLIYMSRGYRLAPYRGRIADITLVDSQTLTSWAVGPG